MICGIGVEGGQRADARANRQAVIDAAIELLTSRPDASMQEIADHSGVGRTTVYRHFESREELFSALIVEVLDRSTAAVAEATGRGGSAAATLRAVGVLNVELGLRFRFLYQHRDLTLPVIQSRTRSGITAMGGFLLAAQKRGEIRDDMPVSWMTAVARSLSMAAVSEALVDRLDQDVAGALLGETLVSALAVP